MKKVLNTIYSITIAIITSPFILRGGVSIGIAVLIYWLTGVATPKEIYRRIISYIHKRGCPFERDSDDDYYCYQQEDEEP